MLNVLETQASPTNLAGAPPVAPPFGERRAEPRLQTAVRVCLDSGMEERSAISDVVLVNISQGGFSTDGRQLVAGERVMIEVPLVGWRESEVRWVADRRAGFRFVEPLSLDELRASVSTSAGITSGFPALAPSFVA